MKKLALTSLVALFAVPVAANAGWYAASHVQTYADQGVDLFDRTDLTASVGYGFENGIRLEADVLSKIISSNTDAAFVLGLNADNGTDIGLFSAKALYDFKNDSDFTPYVGFALTNIDWVSTDAADAFAMDGAFIFGVSYTLTPKWALDFQYNRNFGAVLAFNSSDADTDFEGSSTWSLGAVYKF